LASFGRIVGRGGVTPAIIGAVTLIAEHPGISQAELARLIGLERATVGATVARAIQAGLIRRDDAHDDARRYVLSLTPRGQRMIATLRRRIADHERTRGRSSDRERTAAAAGAAAQDGLRRVSQRQSASCASL
jgi:DNA-binding MarR family transcriptional regulator